MRRVLFVCTGNIFRSLTAEYALRRALEMDMPGRAVHVSSAGTDDFPHIVRPVVSDYLLAQGLDVRAHRRRTLTAAILSQATHIIAMNHDHQIFIRERFHRQVPLYTEACGLGPEPLPDVDDVIPDFENNPVAVAAHVRLTIDRIIELAPRLALRIAADEH